MTSHGIRHTILLFWYPTDKLRPDLSKMFGVTKLLADIGGGTKLLAVPKLTVNRRPMVLSADL